MAWSFAFIVLLPKLETLWRDAGLSGSRAQWLMNAARGFYDNFYYILYGVVFLVMVLELRVKSWRRHRRLFLFIITFLLNSAVIFGILAVATDALLAVPLLAKPK
jgi:hypothetical protein